MTPKRSKKSVATPMDQSDSKDLDITPIQIKKKLILDLLHTPFVH